MIKKADSSNYTIEEVSDEGVRFSLTNATTNGERLEIENKVNSLVKSGKTKVFRGKSLGLDVIQVSLPDRYITNEIHHYLSVSESVEINTDLLRGCTIHPSLVAMYEFVVGQFGLSDVSEIEGSEWHVGKSRDGLVHAYGDRGCAMDIESSVEIFINDFAL